MQLAVKESSGALSGFREQPSAQSKRYHTIEYKMILYTIPLDLKLKMSRRRNEMRIKRSFVECEEYACAVYASDLSLSKSRTIFKQLEHVYMRIILSRKHHIYFLAQEKN